MLLTKCGLLFLYLGTFAPYLIVIITQNPKEYKLVGVAHTIILLISDLMIYSMENYNDNILIQDWFKCCYMFSTRLVCCFLLEYWLALQSIALFLSIIICGSNFFEKMFAAQVESRSSKF